MELYTGTLSVVCLLVVLHDVFASDPELDLSLSPSDSRIYIGEKTVVTARVDFGDHPDYKDVQIVFYPSADVPDFVVTRVTEVKVGENLKITGDVNPIMDFGRKSLQIPGEARSCQFLLGDVQHVGTSGSRDGHVITMKFEAVVVEEPDEDIGPGHEHQLILSMQLEEDVMIISMKQATFHVRRNPLISMPLLFKSLAENYKTKKHVTEMKME